MKRYLPLLILLALPACGGKPKPISETWQAAYLMGARIGHTHTLVTKSGNVIRTERVIELTVKRYGGVLPIKIEQTCEETPDGAVLTLGLRQSLGNDEQTALSARVDGKRVFIKSGGRETPEPWDPKIVGLYAQEQAFSRRKVKTGDAFQLVSFELAVQMALTLRAKVGEEEKVDQLVLADGKATREPAKLLRADITTDKLFFGGKESQLPPKAVWLDDEGDVVREQFEFPGIGLITQYTAPREVVLKDKIDPELLPDLGLNIMINLNKPIFRPYDTLRAKYRVVVTGSAENPFATDERQSATKNADGSYTLAVQSIRDAGSKDAETPGKEFTESNLFIDSDNVVIQALAKSIVGDEKLPIEKARKLEKWVHDNMTFSAAVGFPPASKTARDLRGDCRQHALLLSALLRATHIPSRTALGLIYTQEPGKGPVFAFHMWSEAWLGGRWVALDAIQGKGFVGATHLTMVQHSWAGTRTLAPLLPIAGILGKVKIEIIEAR